MFECSMKKDPRLVEAQNAMPTNITYRSPTIQNEIIEFLKKSTALTANVSLIFLKLDKIFSVSAEVS